MLPCSFSITAQALMLKKLTIKRNLIVTTLPYIFLHFDVAPPQQQVFWYLYFKYFFGWVLVIVLKILLESILPITGCDVSIKGGELFEYIETEGRVDEDVTVRLLRQVLEGVEFLHSQNILHMDIKVR